MKDLVELLTLAAQELFGLSLKPQLSRPEEQFGDYSCNIAMQLAKQLAENPRQVAEKIKDYLDSHPTSSVNKVEVAGPGFLNIFLTDAALWQGVNIEIAQQNKGRKVLLEYSCPNPFKELHTGHLYQTIVGDALGRLLQASGADVFRANFGGDVGLHVAKTLYGIRQLLDGDKPEELGKIPPAERSAWLSKAYVEGSKAYEDNHPSVKTEIEELNGVVYGLHQTDDHQSPLAQIYWECRDWSYDYFKNFYKDLDVAAFDKYYPESQTVQPGLEMVRANIGTVFAEENGAVIFRGEEVGEHTRVFITSKGLPTYEAKDLGVIVSEVQDFAYDHRLIMTGNDQSEYMKVVFAALLQIDEQLALKQQHLANGTIRFGSGKKMSSRLGNVLPATEVLTTVGEAAEAENEQLRSQITLGAIKYAFLKQRVGGDINFDVEESVSLQGNSGPYLQYAHARARSILAKAGADKSEGSDQLEAGERSLARGLSLYPEVINQAIQELRPHHICTYLYELAQIFNRFYENNQVIDDPRQATRLRLVEAYAQTLKHGLELLNIPAPEHL